MKTEIKTQADEQYEIYQSVILLIAMICAILTLIFGYHPKDDIIDNIFFYGLGTVVFTIVYFLIINIIISIIAVIVAFVMTIFTK